MTSVSRTTRLCGSSVHITLLALFAISGCRPEGPQEAFPKGGHGSGPSESHAEEPAPSIEEGHEVDAPSSPTEVDARLDVMLRVVPAQMAVEFEGPEGTPFSVALRTPEIGHYPCTSCHIRSIGQKDEALDQMHAPRPEHEGATRIDCQRCHDPTNPFGLELDCASCHEREGLRDLMPSRTAHLTVELSHPSGIYRNCLTCHAPENPGLLVLRDGRRATLDEAYRLCAGCHFLQGNDWAGGGHGKRLSGWSGERVSLSCTGCHNPHDPQFPVRRPVTFPKIARREAR